MPRLSVKRSTPPAVPIIPGEAPGTPALRRLRTAAVELFAARGYHGVSVRDIAAAMQVKPSSLYAHYASKEQLFAELVLLAHEATRECISDAIANADEDPVAQLRALVRADVLFHATYPLLATIGHNDLHVLSPQDLTRVIAVRKQAVDLLKSVIEGGVREGAFVCSQPMLAIAAIAAIGIRVAAWYRVPGANTHTAADGYAVEIQSWMPQLAAEDVASTFADYALAIVRSG